VPLDEVLPLAASAAATWRSDKPVGVQLTGKRCTADGVLPNGSPGWRFTTALRALNGAALAATKSEVPDPIAGLIGNRLASNVVKRVARVLVDIPEAARLLGADDQTAFVWLRAGAPYVSAGNWSSGIEPVRTL
jgi:hypothetical protein